jgi:hypothetical protein
MGVRKVAWRFVVGLVVVIVLACTLLALAPSWGRSVAGAQNAGGVSFVDDRPAYIDLDGSQRFWDVDVINTGDARAVVSMQVVDAGGVLEITDQVPETIPPEGTGEFDLTLLPRQITNTSPPSTGELLLTASDGSLQRRALTLVHGDESVPPPSDLTLSGWLLAPLLGRVDLPTVAASRYLDDQPAGTLGVVDSAVGRQGFVVDSGSSIRVVGIHEAGSYSGTAVLAPASTTKLDVDVRDTPLWPAIALLVGLAVVFRIDDYSHKTAPRRQLQIRLLRRKAEIEQSQRDCAAKVVHALGPTAEPAVPTLVSVPGDSRSLVYDKIADGSLRAFDLGDQDVRDEWLPTGKAWESTDEALTKCCGFLDSAGALADRFVDLQTRAGGAEAVAMARSLLPVREALQPGAVQSLDALAMAATDVPKATGIVDDFEQALTLLGMAAQLGADPQALRPLRVRLLAGENIDDVCGEAGKLMNAAAIKTAAETPEAAIGTVLHELQTVTARPGITGAPSGPADPAAQPGPPLLRPAASRSRRGGLRLVLALAAIGVAALIVAVMSLSTQGGTGRSASPPTTTTTTTPGLPFTGPVFLPVEPPVVPPLHGRGTNAVTASAWILQAGLTPVIIGLPLAAGLWFLLKRWLGRRSRGTLDSLEADDRQAQRTFVLVSGILVLASGLAVLYVPNPHWGSLGDFLSALLWGTGTTAGLSFARRLIPSS